MTREGVASALAALLLLSGLTACGASPTALGPTGIDELTVPTATPDPADFSADVDNPWFPLAPGVTWTYRRYRVDGYERVRATALPRTRRIAGVDTRPVRWDALCRVGTSCHGSTAPLGVRWYAQDTAGNVWWFGQRLTRAGSDLDPIATRSWVAGRDGAQAGLVMAAAPRVGDGYANASRPGVVERRSTVVSVDATASLPGRTYRHTVLTHDASPLDPVVVVRTYFARGVGLVAQESESASTTQLYLVAQRPGLSAPDTHD
jgi:hypothetical protein